MHCASTACASELAALAASSAGGWEADSAGSLRTNAGRIRCASVAPAGVRCTFVMSAALSVVGIAPAGRPVAPPIALAVSITRPPPSATIIPSPPMFGSNSALSSSTSPGRTRCTSTAPSTTAGASSCARFVVTST